MRALFTFVAVLAGTGIVSAQPPADKLDAYLAKWEARMTAATTLSTRLVREDTDKVFKTSAKYTGWAAYMKSGTGLTAMNKAILELKPEGKAEVSEKVVCTGTYIYQFIPARKEIHAHEMPRGKGGEVADNASLGLMFGMAVAAAKERFALTLANEDKHYVYVTVTPKKAEDRVEFQRAQLVLDRETFLPRRVWLEQPNGNTVQWDMIESRAGERLDPRQFDKPREEPGWRIVPMAAPGAVKPRP